MDKIDLIITDMLQQMEIPPHMKGYAYLRSAVRKVYEDQGIIHAVTKELYPGIAKEYKTSPRRVERGIRFVLEQVNYAEASKLIRVRERVPNTWFIAAFAEALRLLMATETAAS